MKTDLFQSCGHCWVFQICWHIECSTFTASSFKIWKSTTGIPSPPPALFVVMLSKAHLTSHSRMSGSRWAITPSWLSYLHAYMYPFWYLRFVLSILAILINLMFSLNYCMHRTCVHAKSLQLCPTLYDSMNYSPPGSSVHGILQARILEWVAMPTSRGSSQSRDQSYATYVSCIGRWILYL